MREQKIPKGFPERLGRSIYLSGLTTIDIGAMIGVNRKNITYWRMGETCPSAYHLARIAKVLHVSTDWLLFGEKRRLCFTRINEDEPETFPKTDKYILLSFSNYSCPLVGRCEGNKEDGFRFYVGDDTVTCSQKGVFVNGWAKLPKCLGD